MKFLKKIRIRLLLMSIIPLVLMGFINGYFGTVFLARALRAQCLETLRSVCISVGASLESLNDEKFALDADGNLMKGQYNISKDPDRLRHFIEDTNIELSVFYGDDRKATTIMESKTGDTIENTIDSEIVSTVLNGDTYSSVHSHINGEDYYVYYYPMKNPDGEVVGMIFAGEPCQVFEELIIERKHNLIGLSFIVLVIGIVVTAFIATHIGNAILQTEKGIRNLSTGNLVYKTNPKLLKRTDEIGDMARSTDETFKFLQNILVEFKKIADQVLQSGKELENATRQTSNNAGEISKAVEDIALGSTNQAEEVEQATRNVNDMGALIEQIVDNIESLNLRSKNMEQAGEEADRYILDLTDSNNKTGEAINIVAQHVKETDASVGRISEAVKLIQNVAEQTNLLSLNASIEAARAGDAGRGFAVVASEIQKLSEESNQSANKISEIISELLKDSQNSMEMMEEVKERLEEQQRKFDGTKEQFQQVKSDVINSRQETATIHNQARDCDNAREQIIGVITNLSALSEENAASTEETTASMQELNATMQMLADSAENLKKMADNLEEKIAFFKM